MPMVIPAVVTAISYVGASVTAIAAGTATAMQTFAAVAAFGAAAAAGPAFAAMQPGVKPSSTAIEWTAKPDAPNAFPFGRVGAAGNIIHNATYGPDKMYAGFVGVLGCSGPINAYVGFKADDTTVTFDGTGKAITSEYTGEMWVVRQLGNQPESAALATTGLKNSAAMPGWGSSYKLSGKAAYMYTLGENSKRSAYEGKVPTGIHTFEGLLCYDPRLDSTYPGGSGTCRLDDPTTWVYTTNAYIHGLNWVIGRWEGLATGYTPSRYGVPYASMKVGGIGARADAIDWTRYVEAANVFDENDWACAAYPDADEGKASVLDSFLQAGGGIYAERQGKVSCMHRAAPRTSIATITADDTAGTIEYDTTTSLLERINTIRPEYWSEAHGWQMVATEEVSSSVWREEDGQGEEVTRSKGLAYNYVPGSKQARELAALQIAHTREGIRGTAPLRHYLDLEPGDCIDFDLPEAVLNGQKVIILKVDPDVEGDIIHVTFASETDAKYPFAFGQTDEPPPAPSIVPYDPSVGAPGGGEWTAVAGSITGDDGAILPAIVLTGAVDSDTVDLVLFYYRRDGATDWIPYSADSPEIETKQILGLSPGDWEVAIAYRRGRRTSSLTVLAPVGIGPVTASTFVDAGDLAILDQADTPDIVANAVTNYAAASTSGVQTLTGGTPKMIATLTYASSGGRLEVKANFFLTVWHPTAGGISVQTQIKRNLVGNIFDLNVPAINGDLMQGWQTPTVVETLAAGTYTYEVWVTLSTSSGISTQEVVATVLGVREEKR